jgi:hypothetical protein
MRKLEKQMLAIVAIALALLAISLVFINRTLQEINNTGGFKAVFEELWEGKRHDRP